MSCVLITFENNNVHQIPKDLFAQTTTTANILIIRRSLKSLSISIEKFINQPKITTKQTDSSESKFSYEDITFSWLVVCIKFYAGPPQPINLNQAHAVTVFYY